MVHSTKLCFGTLVLCLLLLTTVGIPHPRFRKDGDGSPKADGDGSPKAEKKPFEFPEYWETKNDDLCEGKNWKHDKDDKRTPERIRVFDGNTFSPEYKALYGPCMLAYDSYPWCIIKEATGVHAKVTKYHCTKNDRKPQKTCGEITKKIKSQADYDKLAAKTNSLGNNIVLDRMRNKCKKTKGEDGIPCQYNLMGLCY
jgi:hypothetical protein